MGEATVYHIMHMEKCVAQVSTAGECKICFEDFMPYGLVLKESNDFDEKLRRSQFFGIETDYIFISLPIIDKAEMMNVLMRKIVKKSGEYQNGIHAV